MILNFGDIVKNIIEESKRVSDLNGIASFSYLSDDKVQEVITMDPTYKGGEYAGKYAVYLLDNFIKGNLKSMQPWQVMAALEYFNANRGKMRSQRIQDYSLKELYYLSQEGNRDEERSAIGAWPSIKQMLSRTPSSRYLEVESPNPDYRVFYPLTWEASRKIAGDTKWCTASSTPSSFMFYFVKHDGVFIFVGKDGHAKYQYCMKELDGGELNDANNDDAFNMYDELGIGGLNATDAEQYGHKYLEICLKEEKNKLQERISQGDFTIVNMWGNGDTTEDIRIVHKGKMGVAEYQGRLAAIDISKRKLLSKFEYVDIISMNYGYVVLGDEFDMDDIDYGVIFTATKAPGQADVDDISEAMLESLKEGECTLEELTRGLVLGTIGDYVMFQVCNNSNAPCLIVNRNTLEPSMFDVEIDGRNETVGPLFWNCCAQYVGFGGTDGKAFKISYCNGYSGGAWKIYTDGENVLKVMPPKTNDW